MPQEEHANVFYKYEVSDDLMQVRIYQISDDWRTIAGEVPTIHITSSTNRIHHLLALYHTIREGRRVSVNNRLSDESVIVFLGEPPVNIEVGWFLNFLNRCFFRRVY